MNISYWFRTHIRDILGFALEMVAGFAWMASMFFVIIAFAIFAP